MNQQGPRRGNGRIRPAHQEASSSDFVKAFTTAPIMGTPSLRDPHAKMVTVKVQNATFVVHYSFIYHYCPDFFAKASDESWVEGRSKCVVLEKETTPECFGHFVDWLYRQTLLDFQNRPPPISILIDLWILGDFLRIPSLQNLIIRAIDKHPRKTSIEQEADFHSIWQRTSNDMQVVLRKYLVAQVARSAGEIDSSRMVFPNEMFGLVYNKMRKMRENAERGIEVVGRGAEMKEHMLLDYFVREKKDEAKKAEVQAAEGTDDEAMEDFDGVGV